MQYGIYHESFKKTDLKEIQVQHLQIQHIYYIIWVNEWMNEFWQKEDQNLNNNYV